MSLTTRNYRNYILDKIDDRERQSIGHHYDKAPFLNMLNLILSEYGLEEELRLACQNLRPRLRILDVGCGESLYLHDLSELLETHQVHSAVLFYGIDNHLPSIEVATEYARVSKPPRPYLNFYVHDLRQPLETTLGLSTDGHSQFDLIYARQVIGLIPQAHENLLQLYASLAPGGIIYLDDLIRHEDGWQLPHPALTPLQQYANSTILELNDGIDVATTSAEWLRKAGAFMIQVLPIKMVIGGESKIGMDALRSLIMWLHLVGTQLVELKRLKQTELDNLMQQLYLQLNPQCSGYATFIHTIARKPVISTIPAVSDDLPAL